MNIQRPNFYEQISLIKFNQNKSPLKDKGAVKSIKLDKDIDNNM